MKLMDEIYEPLIQIYLEEYFTMTCSACSCQSGSSQQAIKRRTKRIQTGGESLFDLRLVQLCFGKVEDICIHILLHFQFKKDIYIDIKKTSSFDQSTHAITQRLHAIREGSFMSLASLAIQEKLLNQSFSQKRQAILFQKRLIHTHRPSPSITTPISEECFRCSHVAQNCINLMHHFPCQNPPSIPILKILIHPATFSSLPGLTTSDPLSGVAFPWHVIISIKAMQKTKLISKDFIRDCRTTREHERKETTLYTLPVLPALPLPDCSLFTHEDHYSIEDFILNLQTEELLYYNDPSESPPLLASPRGPTIEQINLQYQQRMAEHPSPSRPVQKDAKGAVVSFERELRAKYFKEEDQPSQMGSCEEYVYECEESEEGSWGMEFI